MYTNMTFETDESVLLNEVSLIKGCPHEVILYYILYYICNSFFCQWTLCHSM